MDYTSKPLKYVDTQVTFAEIPDEITLCINISNCPVKCEGCHSSYLAEDIGTELTDLELYTMIQNNKGITCVSFMGGDSDPAYINYMAHYIKSHFPNFKVAWYSGRQELSSYIKLYNFDFIKLGPYVKELGPLDNVNTNQRFYKIVHLSSGKSIKVDITRKFWKYDKDN